MKIEYRTPPGTGGYAVLADEANSTGLGDSISGYQPQMSKSPQVEALFQSAAVFVADRGNVQWRLSFNVDRQHASADAALAFLVSHPTIFEAAPSAASTNFDLKVTVGAQVVYLANCAPVRFTPEPHSDASTRTAYEFVGGNYTATAP